MPSFDVVSEVNHHEVSNAVDQANREISTRFDFRGSDARIESGDGLVTLHGENAFQLQQMRDILDGKLVKRGVDIAFLEAGEVEETGRRARQALRLRQGIDKDLGRHILKLVKDSKVKVQATLQGDQVRVTGKKRDDLQQVIAALREAAIEQPLQYVNFRD